MNIKSAAIHQRPCSVWRIMRQPTPTIPTDLIARHIAATFVLVLNWWVETDAKLTAAEVDARFRALVLPVLTALRQ
jgi:hypothetical protein